jgi:hypothetical protein
MELRGIKIFISKLELDTLYIIIPTISMFAKDSDPNIILSKQILVSNNSSSQLIHEYFDFKLNQAIIDFGAVNLDGSNYFQLIFKYKKVTFDLSKLP